MGRLFPSRDASRTCLVCENLLTSESLVEPRPGLVGVCLFLKVTPPTYAGPHVRPLEWGVQFSNLHADSESLGCGKPSWGPVAVSMLISSVTFKLSLEAAAAAGHVRRALGFWGRISSAGNRDGEGGWRGMTLRRGDWEPGRARRRAPGPRRRAAGTSSLHPGRGWSRSSRVCELKKKTSALTRVPRQVRVL